MRESDSSESVLRRYESPAMRVIPTDGGRIVVGSPVGFTDDTGLGAFDNGGNAFWNYGSVEGDLGGTDVFDEGVGTLWNYGSIDGDLGEAGVFGDDVNAFWNAASTGGSIVGFGKGAFQEWNGGTASGSGIGGFAPDEGASLQWSDTQ